MSKTHLIAMLKKEFSQIRRDRRLFPLVIFAPVIQLFLFGYAVSLDIKEIPIAIMKEKQDSYSDEILLSLVSSNYFVIKENVYSIYEVENAILRGRVKAGLILGESETNVVIDGSDNNTAALIEGYFEKILAEKRNISIETPVIVPVFKILFNPELRTVNFMVPGVTGLVLLIITMVLASAILVKEKEVGTIEHIFVTPLTSSEVILGKLLPFMVIGFFDLFLVVAAGIFIFKTPFKGNFGLLVFTTFPFILTTLSLGIFVSITSKTQQQAIMTAFMIMLPNLILSGFMFPIENMPLLIQKLTYIVPVKYYLIILRSIFLKGAGLKILWKETLILFVFGFTFLFLSISVFKKKLT
jgi:ABC-2 type transport system permease protein